MYAEKAMHPQMYAETNSSQINAETQLIRRCTQKGNSSADKRRTQFIRRCTQKNNSSADNAEVSFSADGADGHRYRSGSQMTQIRGVGFTWWRTAYDADDATCEFESIIHTCIPENGDEQPPRCSPGKTDKQCDGVK
jgi:hypothetical protein